MRSLKLFIVASVFAAMLIIDPVALARLGGACAYGQCGVRPIWLAGVLAVLMAMLAAWRWRRTRAPPARKASKGGKARRVSSKRHPATTGAPRKKNARRIGRIS